MIQSVIYENNGSSVDVRTRSVLTNSFPFVKVVKESSDELFKLFKLGIDLVFLEMTDSAKIDPMVLSLIKDTSTEIVLICSNDPLPIEIFNHDIFFYLEKPLSEESITRVRKKYELKKQYSRLFMDSDRISIPVKDGWEIIKIEDIVYCQADANYTDLFLIDGKKRKVSKPLKAYAESLSAKSFVRVHQSYLVNSMYMKKLSKDKSPSLFLTVGIEIPVSRSGKKELLKLFV